jgi:hypothetical protein
MHFLLSFCSTLVGGLLACSPGYAQTYRIDLQTEKLDVPASPWHVARVLDLRADRSRLGPVRQGLDNRAVSANFSQPLATALQQFMRAQLPPRAGSRPVVMRVFTLALSEDLRAHAEAAEAELIADFLEPQPDSTFRVLLVVGEATRHGGLDVTKFHASNLALVLQQGLRQLAAVPTTAPTAETLSRADALAGRGGATTQRFAIQAAAVPKRGFYRSFQEFRDNTPSEPDYAFEIEHIAHSGKRWAGTDEVQAVYLRTDSKHQRILVSRSSVWGVSDGKEALIAYRNHFYKLLPTADGCNYTFVGPPLYDEQAAANAAAAAVAGGLIGGAIAGAVSSSAPMLPYEVHLASGRVVPIPEAGHTDADGFQTVPDTARVYIYRRAESPKNHVAALAVANRTPQSLHTCQWTRLIWTDRRHELKICAKLETGTEACHEFVPDFSQPTYLECVVPADGGTPELRPVSAKEGLFELKRIQRLAKAGK